MTLTKQWEPDCVFCQITPDKKILQNELAFCVLDIHPVTPGHSLIIPNRHFADYFDITPAELEAVQDLACLRRKQLLESDPAILGFNIGSNCGAAAGQRIFHTHIHLIPRRKGDGLYSNNE
jgi:diadenosine tetraphosphate (Ap4A) HIT family hydrolase